MGHYFMEEELLEDNIENFPYNCRGKTFVFQSNSGMFSPGHVDYATDILLNHIPDLSGRVLDMGCGYGVIGIVLGRLFGVDVTMADINGRALKEAAVNCVKNEMQAELIETDGFADINGVYHAVVTNPPIHAGKETVFGLYKGARDHLEKDGILYVIIQKKHGAESSIKELNGIFGNCETIYKKKGFYILKSIRKH